MSTTDQKTLELIALVSRQKAEIALAEKPQYRTNCSFTYIEGNMNSATNIRVESDVKNLVLMVAFLQEKETGYQRAISTLGVDEAPAFSWNGFSVTDWVTDIRTRINNIQIGTKKKKLEALEARLNNIVSPQLRAELELKAIENELM